MDYLEDVKYRDIADVTLEEAKEEILSYEEFAKVKDAEMIVNLVNTTDNAQVVVRSEEVTTEIAVMEADVSEVVEEVPEVIDYTKLSIEERAKLLPVPTDDYATEYDAYCLRMGYTAEKMKSIRYKMTVYDEFLEEYQYRKKHYGVRDDSKSISVSEKSKEAR